MVSCGSRSGSKQVVQAADSYSFTVVAAYPHDPTAYTQGLFWHDGRLWESTGEYSRSTMRQVDPETGNVLMQTELPDRFFGEGAAILDGKIYQLTWFERTVFVWDPADLTQTATLPYPAGLNEGWGLTTDGSMLYASDGTPNISVVDPANLRIRRTIAVRHNGAPLRHINELEWIDGRIWANIYLTNNVAVIDPETGNVEAMIDLSAIARAITITPTTDVMNGIAHDPETRRTFLTGKNWDKLFEIKISKQ